MNTYYPTEQLSFNEWTAYIQNENNKKYIIKNETEQSFGKNQKQ